MVKDKDDELDEKADSEEKGGEGEEGGEGGKKSPLKGKRLLIILVGVAVLLIAIVAGLYFTGIIGHAPVEDEPDEQHQQAQKAKQSAVKEDSVFYEMDEFLVNLNTGGKQVKFLKMKVLLELPNQNDVAGIELKMPRIRDSFQVYLRELRSEDLQGSGGLYRLREELLLRVNKEIYPVQVRNILFKDILVQ